VIQVFLPAGLSIDTVFFRARLGEHIPAVQGRTRCKEAPSARRPGRKKGKEAGHGSRARKPGKDAIRTRKPGKEAGQGRNKDKEAGQGSRTRRPGMEAGQ